MAVKRLVLVSSILAASTPSAAAAETVNPLDVLNRTRRDLSEFDKRMEQYKAQRQKQKKEQEAKRKQEEAEQQKREKAEKALQEEQRKREAAEQRRRAREEKALQEAQRSRRRGRQGRSGNGRVGPERLNKPALRLTRNFLVLPMQCQPKF